MADHSKTGSRLTNRIPDTSGFWMVTVNINFIGFYDLVWLEESSLLVCSVFDSIQVWDMSSYTCVSIISGNLLDGVGLKSWCFHAAGKTLFCGTNKGQVKFFNLTIQIWNYSKSRL